MTENTFLRGETSKNKKPAEPLRFSGPESRVLANSAAHPRRRAVRAMVVMMVLNQHESINLRDAQ